MNSNANRCSGTTNKRQNSRVAFASEDVVERANGETTPLSGNRNVIVPRHSDRRKDNKNDTYVVAATIAASFLVILLCLRVIISSSFSAPQPQTSSDDSSADEYSYLLRNPVKNLFDEHGRFIYDDFDVRPAFSDFLPGVAGIYGKPLWAFYVNRGQGIASFGTQSKEYPIMQFSTANNAYQNTALLGFRTFLQGSRGTNQFFSEPFSPANSRHNSDDFSTLPKRYMYVGANEVQIQEIDFVNRIETNVSYFTLPEEDFGALVRRTTITNLDNQHPLQLSALDGLARVQPAGGKLAELLNSIGRTLEGWMGVYSADNDDSLTMPFYRLSTEPGDTASVKVQEAGHYCLSILEGGDPATLLPIIYDTSKVFGEDTMLLRAVGLESKSVGDLLKEQQYGYAKTSSAFAAVDDKMLEAGESLTIASFYGKAEHITDLAGLASKVTQLGYSSYKNLRARKIVTQIAASVETKTGNHLFDGHVQQMFLDNSLRGGIPTVLGNNNDNYILNADEDSRLKVYHIFSRIHGDLERDYNDFEIDPTFFSQGPGNFRDVIQNRRNDVMFKPKIGSFNIKMFLSFLQADGYEPLNVEAVVFTIGDKSVCRSLAEQAVGHADDRRAQRETLSSILCNGTFRPGQLFLLLEEQNIELILTADDFMDRVAEASEISPMAVFNTGFWADHWTYYMDLIDSYTAVYPDQEENLLFLTALPYFFSPAMVRPRSRKYVLSQTFDGIGYHIRQLHATDQQDEEKIKLKKAFTNNTTGWLKAEANWQRDATGKIFKSSPITKLMLLVTLKFATRDPYGMGIEYEGGRPGWNDAMNGLAGMIGSGMPETFELEIMLRYVLSVVSKYNRRIHVPRELGILILSINTALGDLSERTKLTKLENKVPEHLFGYWDTVATAREDYRESVKFHFSDKTTSLAPVDMIKFLRRWIEEVDLGKARALKLGSRGDGDDGNSGIMPTYFSFNVTKWKNTGEFDEEGRAFILPLEMEVGSFPLFLEGPVRMMKAVDVREAANIYAKVRKSALHDKELNMYTISASLKGQSYDMGRMMAFTPGWLENQSVWLHMSYKFYLQLIRKDLFDEFFNEFSSGGMLPFMEPSRYGRSLMECSSFIASSAFEDPSRRGRGFLARLSGSTAEFLSMWILMMIGPNPFFVDEYSQELRMQLVPALPLWIFESDTEEKNDAPLQVSFNLFASIKVTYHNERKQDLYRVPPNRYVVGLRDGSVIPINDSSIPQWLSDKIRRVVFVDYIDVFFE